MISPQPSTLRRRAKELRDAAARELVHDDDSAALLMFYAAECGLKSVYMRRNNLKDTEEVRGRAKSARSYAHHLDVLLMELHIPAIVIPKMPKIVLKRTGASLTPHLLHEAWRYGEKVDDVKGAREWLEKIEDWARREV